MGTGDAEGAYLSASPQNNQTPDELSLSGVSCCWTILWLVSAVASARLIAEVSDARHGDSIIPIGRRSSFPLRSGFDLSFFHDFLYLFYHGGI